MKVVSKENTMISNMQYFPYGNVGLRRDCKKNTHVDNLDEWLCDWNELSLNCVYKTIKTNGFCIKLYLVLNTPVLRFHIFTFALYLDE